MSKQQLQCEQAAKNAYVAAMAEVSLFCKILGYPDSQANYLIGDDPHGIVDIMEGYRIFNMTDIHVVLSEYERWLKLYGSNEEIRIQVDAWHFYRLEQKKRKFRPNLRSWLAGCPVRGLRKATPEYFEQRHKAQEAAHNRVEVCLKDLLYAMEEEVKLNKF